MNRWFIILPAALAAFAIVSPSDFHTNFGTRVLIYSIFALSLNILVGYAGLMSLCHSAFFGLAGYSVAWLSVFKGWSAPAAIATALLLTTAIGAVFGALALRAKGIGFLMITLALGQIAWGLAVRWSDVTGGENGIRGIKRAAPLGINIDAAISFYVLTSIVFLVVCFAMYAFTRSPFGASLCGTRDQPRRMSALGYDVGLIQWISFVLASFFAGISGVLGVFLDKFISPGVMSLTWSAEGLLMVIVGGASAFLGPVVGTALVLVFTHVVSSFVDRWTAALGVLFLTIVMFMPNGLVPGCRKLIEQVGGSGPIGGRTQEAP
ncbi:MAG: branched-chain amino acid ABC transporter permease [Hyphomicrobiales bacterium]|nr:branched-chain amino acid ABC transporter permease [Hyphomicrobiales bacterium]